MKRLLEWLRANHLRRLEANVRSAAAAYQQAKARYENAIIAERLKDAD